MTTDPKQQAIKNAHRAAREGSYGGWFFLGFFVPFVAVLLAFASKPIMPGRVMASHEDESTRRIFETSYLHRVNEERVATAYRYPEIARSEGTMEITTREKEARLVVMGLRANPSGPITTLFPLIPLSELGRLIPR